jgi:Na+-driven multidrug efflux pump
METIARLAVLLSCAAAGVMLLVVLAGRSPLARSLARRTPASFPACSRLLATGAVFVALAGGVRSEPDR